MTGGQAKRRTRTPAPRYPTVVNQLFALSPSLTHRYPTVVNQLFSLFSCRLLDGGPPRPVCPDPWDGGTCVEDRAAVGLYWSQDLDQRCYR